MKYNVFQRTGAVFGPLTVPQTKPQVMIDVQWETSQLKPVFNLVIWTSPRRLW